MFDYIVAHNRLPEAMAGYFFLQVCSGVSALHKSFVTHRDLKPEVTTLKHNHTYVVFTLESHAQKRLA
jgi:serine/threonine protein kinase